MAVVAVDKGRRAIERVEGEVLAQLLARTTKGSVGNWFERCHQCVDERINRSGESEVGI